MEIRDRIKGFRRVKPTLIRENPRNWRTHSDEQRQAIQAMFAAVGLADVLKVRKLDDGTYELIDGHLRRSELGQAKSVPILVLDVTEQEADLLLATFDPIGNLAGADQDKLDQLVAGIQVDEGPLADLLEELRVRDGEVEQLASDEQVRGDGEEEGVEEQVEAVWQLIVECPSKAVQGRLAKELGARGFQIRRRKFMVDA